MNECDVLLTIQKARDKYPFARPSIITDNDSQFNAKEFKKFIKETEFSHVKTSISNLQANSEIERYPRTISEACLRIKASKDLDNFIIYIKEYMNFYSTQRLYASINYLTPEDYILGRMEERMEQRELKLENAETNRALYWNSKNKAA